MCDCVRQMLIFLYSLSLINNTRVDKQYNRWYNTTGGDKQYKSWQTIQELTNNTRVDKQYKSWQTIQELINNTRVDKQGNSWYSSTARSREDETLTLNGHQNRAFRFAKRSARESSQVSFQMAHLKRDLNFDHRGFRCAFRRAFRVSSSRGEQAVSHTGATIGDRQSIQ